MSEFSTISGWRFDVDPTDLTYAEYKEFIEEIRKAKEMMLENGIEANKVYLSNNLFYVKPFVFDGRVSKPFIYGMEVEVANMPKGMRFAIMHDDSVVTPSDIVEENERLKETIDRIREYLKEL